MTDFQNTKISFLTVPGNSVFHLNKGCYAVS